MNIIQINANENGGRPPMQSWHGAPPAGYALVPDTLDVSTFYDFMGFVTLELDGSTVTAMTGNQEALDAYKASLPEPAEPEPTTEERVAALEAENKLLKEQVKMQSQQQTFLEDCLLEISDVVYA